MKPRFNEQSIRQIDSLNNGSHKRKITWFIKLSKIFAGMKQLGGLLIS